jgi:hypothetical protein
MYLIHTIVDAQGEIVRYVVASRGIAPVLGPGETAVSRDLADYLGAPATVLTDGSRTAVLQKLVALRERRTAVPIRLVGTNDVEEEATGDDLARLLWPEGGESECERE